MEAQAQKRSVSVTPDLSALRDQETRKSYSPAAMKAFVRIAEKWDLSVPERCVLLGDIPKATYYKWARGDVSALSRDVLERIGIVLGIHKGLQLFFAEEGGRLRWFKAPNHDYAFHGKSPLGRMLDGGVMDLYAVRQYIDALRGGH
jgi:hypothetical protein